MNGGAISSDGGRIWTDLTLPTGTSAATFSAAGSTLFAGALDGDTARTCQHRRQHHLDRQLNMRSRGRPLLRRRLMALRGGKSFDDKQSA